ncbi:unnamed protein product [Phytophthora lilii]|uniref:Unnamed protein product n=1 Tax=Phytophthora lilii TaxID=2077276 RepID=A0A9W6TF67_9STRA|nr:unnamed protein product [Phytophthora lilii]
MPSPLAKDRQSGSQIPTPRSIIADALSRAPLSALPPLEIQNPPSASKKKKTDAGKQKSAAPPLSPTDPFFSPRFRFDGGAPGPKVIKLVGITSPRSAAASSVEIQTPKSSNSKRERRKSSVKKPPTTADGGGRSQKSNADERTKSAPTPRQSEESFSLSIDEQNTMGGEAAVITSTLPTREIGAMDEGGEAAAITSTLPTKEIGAMDEGVEALRPNQDPNTLENVQGASAASSETVDESEHTRPSSLEPEQHDRRTISVVDSITVLHEQGHSLNFHPPGNFDDTEVNQAVDRNDLAKHELQRASTPQTEASVDKSKEGPVDIVLEAVYEAISLLLTRVINEVEEMNNIILDSDSVNNSVVPEEEVSDPVLHVELALLVEDSSDTTQLDEGPRDFNEKVADHKDREEISSHYTQQETVKEEDTASLEALSMVASDDILELVHMEGPQKLEGDAIEDVASEAKLEFLGKDQVEVATDTEVYVEDTPVDVKTLDTAAPFESAAIGNVEDVVQEAHPELTIESHPTAEGDTLDEQFHLLPVNFNNIDDAVLQNDIHDCETLGDTELAYSTPDMTEHGADLAESGQGVLPSDVDEQGDVHERGEFNILNVAEDLETTSVDHGSKEYYPDSAQYGDHGEPSASIEVEAELHDSGYEDIPHREIHTESQFPLASVDAYHSKPVMIDYEQPSYEDITVPRINEVEQEWNHSELATVESTADYNEYYQESSVAPHEEHLQYDAASGNYNDHAQETEVSPLLTDPPDFNQNPAEGCTDIPDPDTTE